MSVKKLTTPILIPMLVLLAGCGREAEVHEYTEIVQLPATPTPAMPATPRLADLMEGMRAAPLTVDPVPENLPPDHPTLTGPMTGPLDGPSAPGAAMRGREGEVPPPSSAADLVWTLPTGWAARPGSGMRAAEFLVEAEADRAVATLISLPGMAGAMEANVARWRGQVGLSEAGGEAPREIEGKLPFFFVNLAPESVEAGLDQTTMAAIYRLPERTLFLKFTGATDVVAAHKLDFLELAGSMERKADSP